VKKLGFRCFLVSRLLLPVSDGRTQLSEELLKHDVDVSWWVTPTAYDEGYYTKLYHALGHWLAEELPFKEPCYSNREIPIGGT
jgi:hypothetical protein